VDVAIYTGSTLKQALARFQDLGEKLNLGNPTIFPTTGKDHRNALRSRLGFWKAIGADSTVLSWIYYGLPHRQFKPAQRGTYKNSPSAHKHAEFVTAFISSQIATGRAKEVPADFPELVMSLLVEEQLKSDGSIKKRPCVSMVPANATLADMQFTLETPRRHGRDGIAADDALATIDRKDAYFHEFMDATALPYLCVSWRGKLYASLCLMFGHRLGPFYFTKLMRPVLAFFRTLLLKVLGYLGTFVFFFIFLTCRSLSHTHASDDFLLARGQRDAKEAAAFMVKIKQLLGFDVSPKSDLACGKLVEFLGFMINTTSMKYSVPERKINKLIDLIRAVLADHTKNASVLYSALHTVEGTMASMSLAIPPIMLWVRDLVYARTRSTEGGQVILTELEAERLGEVPALLLDYNGADILPAEACTYANMDGGGVGGGGYIHAAPTEEEIEFTMALAEGELDSSSTYRELRTIVAWLKAEGKRLSRRTIRLYMDSANGVRDIIKFGTTSNCDTHELCREIFDLCRKFLITLQPEWVPRELNKRADALSKKLDRAVPNATTRTHLIRNFGSITRSWCPSSQKWAQHSRACSWHRPRS
jgi:ribonuclease HI